MSDEVPIDAYDPPKPTPDGLPSSVHIEVATLGAMLLEEDAINDALEVLVAEDFSLDSHQRVYRCIVEMVQRGHGIDILTVRDELKRRRELDSVGGDAYLAFLTEGIPRNFNIESYVRIVKDKSILRRLMGIGHDLSVRASDQSEDPYALLEATEELILELSQSGQSQGFSTLLDSVQEAGGVEPFVGKMYDPALMTGLPMGFVDVDKVLGGMQKKELTIVAARPSQGKSAYVLCVAINVHLADPAAVVAFFSVEMSKIALHKRLLAVLAGVNTRKAAEGWLSREERIRLGSAVVKAGDWNLEIDDSSTLTVTQMRAKSRRLKKQKGRLDLVIVDYLQLIRGTTRYNNREQEVSSVSRGLKALAKELDVPVMAVAMVGRGSERHGDKRPMLSDLRESGSIEQDADVVLFIHREEYYHSEDDPDVERGIAEILIAKNREGATGTRKLAYQAEYTRFANLALERN